MCPDSVGCVGVTGAILWCSEDDGLKDYIVLEKYYNIKYIEIKYRIIYNIKIFRFFFLCADT